MAEDFDVGRTAVVFFDMLKRYDYGPDLKTLLPEAAAQVNACVRLLGAARSASIPVFYACGHHRPDGRDLATAITDDELTRGGPRQGPSYEGQEIIAELAPQTDDYVILKHRWSMFFQTELELSLRARDIDTILLAGGSTEVGIASSCYAARDLDFNAILVRECLRSGRGKQISDFFVDRIAGNIARTRSLDEVLGVLGTAAATSEGAGPAPA